MPALSGRDPDLNFGVETAGTTQRGVQRIWSIGGTCGGGQEEDKEDKEKDEETEALHVHARHRYLQLAHH